jgi:hypothetical protein
MSAMRLPSLYEPLNEYKSLAPRIGIVDGPFEYLTMSGVRLPLAFTTRMTVVQLKNDDLFLHSPIAFDAKLAGHLHRDSRGRYGSPRIHAVLQAQRAVAGLSG